MGKILIVEDDRVLRETLAEILEFTGHNVLEAGNGKEGIIKINESAPELIICDINMPFMDGFEMLKKLHKLHKEDEIPPFIFLSAKTEEKNIRRGLNMGAVDFVTKPYSATELLKLIDSRLKE